MSDQNGQIQVPPLQGAPLQGPPLQGLGGDADGHYRVLARKSRPSDFSGLVGQDALVRTLTNAIAAGRLAHAFMLTGVRGIGKTTTARILARAFKCVGPHGKGGPTASPCGQCEHCTAIAEDRHVDVIEMDAASRTGRGRRFAVRARSVGDTRFPFRGRDVDVALGEKLRGVSAGVDLDHPEFTARVELYEGAAYTFAEVVPGVGGLPLGSGGRVVALVSGGFDSAVAAWQLQRRGVVLNHVFANLGGLTPRLGTLRVMEVLARGWSYGTRPRLHVVDFAAVSRDLQAKAEKRYWQVLLKRLMLRAAEAVAKQTRAHAIVTGEAVGQVSSQTLVNLATISEVTRLPILRPMGPAGPIRCPANRSLVLPD